MTKKLSPEKRKSQIIQAALELFKDKGYSNTSVRNIIDEVGISKGGFYHHYSSKEELLQEIAQLFLAEIMDIIQNVNKRDDLTALEKLNKHIKQANSYKKKNTIEVVVFLYEIYSGGKNMQLEKLIFEYAKKELSPIMSSIIMQGVEEGDFRTDYPEEAADLYIKLLLFHQSEVAGALLEALNEDSREKLDNIKRKYSFLQEVLEDILGLKRDSLVLKKVAEDTIENITASKIFSDYIPREE